MSCSYFNFIKEEPKGWREEFLFFFSPKFNHPNDFSKSDEIKKYIYILYST